MKKSVAERQVLRDAINVCRIHRGPTAKIAAAFGTLALGQVTPTGAGIQDFSAGRNFKTFGRGLFGFDAFGTSHKSNLSKRARNICDGVRRSKRHFVCLCLKGAPRHHHRNAGFVRQQTRAGCTPAGFIRRSARMRHHTLVAVSGCSIG